MSDVLNQGATAPASAPIGHPSSDMVERVARAIAEEINGGKFDDNRWYNDDQREVHRRRARAAIAAMREPTQVMLEAGQWHENFADSHALESWRDMIDEALKPSKDSPLTEDRQNNAR